MSTIALSGVRRRRSSILGRISAAFAVRRSRLALGELSDYILADVGLTRGEAEAEAKRPLWDVPQWWRC